MFTLSLYNGERISIHALLAESDDSGEETPLYYWQFLSTLSLRRATQHYGSFRDLTVISIHALLAESDQQQSDC